MPGWLSCASAWASRVNRSANAGFAADARRQNFQRDKPVELLLPRLVNRAHAAFADEFKDFELREQSGNAPRRRAGRTRVGRSSRFPFPRRSGSPT